MSSATDRTTRGDEMESPAVPGPYVMGGCVDPSYYRVPTPAALRQEEEWRRIEEEGTRRAAEKWAHPLIPHETDGVKGASLYAMALDRWGRVPQTHKAVEECGELITALMHALDGRNTPEAVAEEIADVQIMCEQMALVYGPELVAEKKREKLARLAGLLGGAA